VRDKFEEGSKGTLNPLRAFARAFSWDTFSFLVVVYQILFRSQQKFREIREKYWTFP